MYNRGGGGAPRINNVKIWVGVGLKGGNYEAATNVGTINYVTGQKLYTFTGLSVSGSSVELQGGDGWLHVAEVEVYSGLASGQLGAFCPDLALTLP